MNLDVFNVFFPVIVYTLYAGAILGIITYLVYDFLGAWHISLISKKTDPVWFIVVTGLQILLLFVFGAFTAFCLVNLGSWFFDYLDPVYRL